MQVPSLPDRIMAFLGLLPSTLFLFGSTSIVLHELSPAVSRPAVFFVVGAALFSASFAVWLFSFLLERCVVLYYRRKYPLSGLNKAFHIISFGGRVCLLDTTKNEIRWVKSWQTALDLGFVGEWTDIDAGVTSPSALSSDTLYQTKGGQHFRLCDFEYASGIHTRGIPGT